MGTYKINDLAKKYNLKTSTIRYYEEIGLLENVEHVNDYHRVFTDEHVNRLGAIECFKQGRIPLEDIKRFFELEKDYEKNSGEIIEMMKEQEAKTIAEIQTLEAGLAHIRKKITYYSAVDTAVKEGRPVPTWHELMD